MSRYYLPRLTSGFRRIKDEDCFARHLKQHFQVNTLDLARLTNHEQSKLLRHADLVIFASGSAGLATIFCNPSAVVVEISPRSIFLNDVELCDSYYRGGPHHVYVCDRELEGCSPSGDPRYMEVDYRRFDSFLQKVLSVTLR